MEQLRVSAKPDQDVLAPLKLNNPGWKEQMELAKEQST
jgi:hypothetical protein